MKLKTRLYCYDFIQVGFSNECCDSCHDDDELGYSEMIFLEPDGRSKVDAYICCGMSRVLEGSDIRNAFAQALLARRIRNQQ